MGVVKMSVSLPPELADEIRHSAERQSMTVSVWLAGAARARLRNERLGEAVRDWESVYGPITEEEKAAAREIFRHADALRFAENDDPGMVEP